GLPVEALLWLKAHPRFVGEIGEALIQSHYVRYAAATTGEYQLLVHVAVPDVMTLHQFTTSGTWAEHVDMIETSMLLAAPKRTGVLHSSLRQEESGRGAEGVAAQAFSPGSGRCSAVLRHGSDGEDLLRVPDGAGDVVQHGAGDPLAGGSEGDRGVQSGPVAFGLAVQVDGEVDVGEHPLGGRLAHRDAVGGVDAGEVGGQGAGGLPGDEVEGAGDPGRGPARLRLRHGAEVQGRDVPAGPRR